jgi:hypothetical protein
MFHLNPSFRLSCGQQEIVRLKFNKREKTEARLEKANHRNLTSKPNIVVVKK